MLGWVELNGNHIAVLDWIEILKWWANFLPEPGTFIPEKRTRDPQLQLLIAVSN